MQLLLSLKMYIPASKVTREVSFMRLGGHVPHKWLHKAMDRSVCSFITSCKTRKQLRNHSANNAYSKCSCKQASCSPVVKHPSTSPRQFPGEDALIIAFILAVSLALTESPMTQTHVLSSGVVHSATHCRQQQGSGSYLTDSTSNSAMMTVAAIMQVAATRMLADSTRQYH